MKYIKISAAHYLVYFKMLNHIKQIASCCYEKLQCTSQFIVLCFCFEWSVVFKVVRLVHVYSHTVNQMSVVEALKSIHGMIA